MGLAAKRKSAPFAYIAKDAAPTRGLMGGERNVLCGIRSSGAVELQRMRHPLVHIEKGPAEARTKNPVTNRSVADQEDALERKLQAATDLKGL